MLNYAKRMLTKWVNCLFIISVLNVKVIDGSFNQEKALVRAFTVIVNLRFKLYHRRRLGYGDCFRSVFSLHNETVNIWTHLLGFLFFLVLMVKDLVWAQDHIRDTADYGATALQLLTYQACMLASSLFHTLSCHESGPRWLSLDQASILLALYATYAKFLLTQLSCWPHHQA